MFDNDDNPLDLSALTAAFRNQLLACLEECAHGRNGLFGTLVEDEEWPEAVQLRSLAMALQQLAAQDDAPILLVDEFLDLCSITGENNPGEPRMARAFLKRIDADQLGVQDEKGARPW